MEMRQENNKKEIEIKVRIKSLVKNEIIEKETKQEIKMTVNAKIIMGAGMQIRKNKNIDKRYDICNITMIK